MDFWKLAPLYLLIFISSALLAWPYMELGGITHWLLVAGARAISSILKQLSIAAGLPQRFNNWLVATFRISHTWVIGVEVGALFGLGIGMIDLELYAVATFLWVILGIAIIVKLLYVEIHLALRIAGILLVIACIAVIIDATNTKRDGKPWWPKKCTIRVDVRSAMLARAHLRAMWHPSSQGSQTTDVYKPVFQDLFHEWTIEATPNREASQVVISVRDAEIPADKIRVIPPENALISEPKPGWVSGFEEPTQVPDFYVRTITLLHLSAKTMITIRRPIKSHFGESRITSLDLNLDRQILVSADGCAVMVDNPFATISNPLSDANPHFRELTDQLRALLVQHVTGGPIATRPDPTESYPPLATNESELVEEAKCQDAKCEKMLVTMVEKSRVQ